MAYKGLTGTQEKKSAAELRRSKQAVKGNKTSGESAAIPATKPLPYVLPVLAVLLVSLAKTWSLMKEWQPQVAQVSPFPVSLVQRPETPANWLHNYTYPLKPFQNSSPQIRSFPGFPLDDHVDRLFTKMPDNPIRIAQPFIHRPHSLVRLTQNFEFRAPNAGVALYMYSNPASKSASQSSRQELRQYSTHAAVARIDTLSNLSPKSRKKKPITPNAFVETEARLASGSPHFVSGVNCQEEKSEDELRILSHNITYDMCNDCPAVNTTRFQDLCAICYAIKSPMVKLSRKYNLKENRVLNVINAGLPLLMPGVDFSGATFDKTVNGGRDKPRPDFYLRCGGHNMVVEVDEDQHTGYRDEEERINTIVAEGGRKPTWVIRINPDSFKKGRVPVKSCFEGYKDENGQLVIRDMNEWIRRMYVLLQVMKKAVLCAPDQPVKEVKLYYTVK